MAIDPKIEKAIIEISALSGLNKEALEKLVELTNENSRVQFIHVKGYNSDKSLNTEVANHRVNINAKYENMLDKDALTLASPYEVIKKEFLETENGWNYDRYDLAGVPLNVFRAQVKDAFGVALAEKQKSKVEPKERVSNDIWLNKALVFNVKHLTLSIFGTSLEKSVKQEGVFKKVKSAPLTVAKQIIDNCTEMKGAKLRRFKLDNLNGMKLQGEELEIGGGQKEGVEIKVN